MTLTDVAAQGQYRQQQYGWYQQYQPDQQYQQYQQQPYQQQQQQYRPAQQQYQQQQQPQGQQWNQEWNRQWNQQQQQQTKYLQQRHNLYQQNQYQQNQYHQQQQQQTGAWSQGNAADGDATKALETALGNAVNYAPEGSLRLCFKNIQNVKQQVVAGTNYDFQVEGCKVNAPTGNGRCGGETSECGTYSVRVFSQPWTSTQRVQSITRQ
ncbi:TPA: hypothetical protein N0F65_009411 [Lagenidium giganteum]|uniref:Uncharacterized protein n=1 Tax=Lagenidium giganteum TaxID=4803 RepID=A0AAV2ZG63_9STRA|nr:TPA: hypothetical protein N0F65_009411 [Lagenidium giganteum]